MTSLSPSPRDGDGAVVCVLTPLHRLSDASDFTPLVMRLLLMKVTVIVVGKATEFSVTGERQLWCSFQRTSLNGNGAESPRNG
ncbi:MAG: hypothetical protein U0528_02525 [Anaerolineae bacterium]